MNKFNLLIIGEANHQYNINFTKNLKLIFPNVSVKIINWGTNNSHDNQLSIIYDEIYNSFNQSNLIYKIRGIRTFVRAWQTYRTIVNNKLGSDAILVQYLVPWLSLICSLIRNQTKNFIVVPWGSDIFRSKYKKVIDIFFNNADNIIIGSPQVLELFNVDYKKYKSKFHLCFFGNEPIEYIRKIKDSLTEKSQSCDYFNLSRDKLNITIGHNGSNSHQHIPILREFIYNKINHAYNVRFILPMTYGLNAEYLDDVKKTCEEVGIECVIYSEFMNDTDVAHLRNLTDIMINLQTTDGFSGSMREVMYCGGVVISGSWLPYQFLKKIGIYYEEVKSIEELPAKLNKILSDYSLYREQCKDNPSKIYDISSWHQVIYKWKEIIELHR
jgi:hypothetical protein